jgi:hypothetical protein
VSASSFLSSSEPIPWRRRLATAGLLALAAVASLAVFASSGAAQEVHPYKSTIDEFNGGEISPAALAVDSSTDLYAAEQTHGRVDKFDSAGAPVSSWGSSGRVSEVNGIPFGEVPGIAVDSTDHLWLTDGHGGVVKLTPTGAFETQAEGPEPGGSFPETANLRSLAWSDAADKLFVADSTADVLWGLDPDGTYSGTSFSEGLGGGCCEIRIAADNSAATTAGDLYVSTGGGIVRIHGSGAEAGEPDPFAAAGPYIDAATLTGSPRGVAGATAAFGTINGLSVDSAGHLYVAEGDVVDEFDPSGAYVGVIRGTPTGPGGAVVPFTEPGGVGVGSAGGNLYVSDRGFIRVFEATTITLPDVASAPATAVTTTAATLHGEVNPLGLEVEECVFEYGEGTTYGQSAPCEAPDAAELGEGLSQVAVHADLEHLRPGATYHYRLAATNQNGTNSESADQIFFSGASIESTSALQITATSAVLEAELNPHGLPSSYHFEYDTTPYAEGGAPHGISTATGSAGSTTTAVHRSASIGSLQPATTYHFRVVAENPLGSVEGPDRSFTTEGPAGPALPDGRAWEMVSPPDKNGVPLEGIAENGGVIQAAANGSGLAYISRGAISAAAPGTRSFAASQLLARRQGAGWNTEDITTPNEAERGLSDGFLGEYKLFSPDLSLGAVQPEGGTPLSPATSERTPYLRGPDGTYAPLVVGCPAATQPCPPAVREQANVPPGTEFGGTTESEGGEQLPEVFSLGVDLLTASPDLAHIVLTAPTVLTGGPPDSGQLSLYEWSAGALQPLSLIPAGSSTTCGGTGPPCVATAQQGLESFLGRTDKQMRHAVSDDGNRAIFETPGAGTPHLYLRDLARGETLMLDATETGAPGAFAPAFQTASVDGSRVFFTDGARLTGDSTATPEEPDLYMCQIGEAAGRLSCALADLSANGVDPSEPADVQGLVVGASEDGSEVYFVAQGALTEGEGAVHGGCAASAGQCNLYRFETATQSLSLVAVLSALDAPDWATGGTGTFDETTSRVSPDGRWLAFMSERSLTGYDNRDVVSGERDQEVFLYHAGAGGEPGVLRCASCNPTGARPHGLLESPHPPFPLVDRPHLWEGRRLAANIPGWTRVDITRALYQSRYLSDSGRLFFNSFDALVPQDSNGNEDVYEYEPPGVGSCTESSSTFGPASGGCVGPISPGASGQESAFLDASESGDDVFFLTASQLVRKDADTALDVYDAHACSASSPCPAAEEARSPECDGDACQQPAVPPAHPTPGTSLLNGPGNVLQCPKGKVKQKGKCVKKKQKKAKRHHKKGKNKKKSSSKGKKQPQGGASKKSKSDSSTQRSKAKHLSRAGSKHGGEK